MLLFQQLLTFSRHAVLLYSFPFSKGQVDQMSLHFLFSSQENFNWTFAIKSKSKKTKQTSDKRNHSRSKSWKPYGRKRLCTVDLLKITILDQHIFIFKIFSTFVTKQATLMRSSIALILPLQLVFPGKAVT
jgi:hypothetical protein